MASPSPWRRSGVVSLGLWLAFPASCHSDSGSVASTGGGASDGLAESGTGGSPSPSAAGGRGDGAGASAKGGSITGPATGGVTAGPGGTTGLGGSAGPIAGSAPDQSDGGDSAAGASATGGVNTSKGGSSSGGSAAGGEQNSATGGRTDPPDDPPTVLLLLDSSTSMFETAPPEVARPWDWAFEALLAEDGPINELQARIRFGFTAYRGSDIAHAEEDLACADLSTVDFGFDQYAEIRALYETLGADYEVGVKWETPTGHAIRRATEALLGDATPGRKYIVLVTDGIPNTCQTVDPQCGQDQAIFAVQQAHEAGITTYGLGIGNLTSVNGNTGCDPLIARCGADHLQDLANAGLGLPVLEPPDEYLLQPCVNVVGGYVATYSPDGGSAPAHVTTSVAELRVALAEVFEMIVAGAP
jgi:hypothetical protein